MKLNNQTLMKSPQIDSVLKKRKKELQDFAGFARSFRLYIFSIERRGQLVIYVHTTPDWAQACPTTGSMCPSTSDLTENKVTCSTHQVSDHCRMVFETGKQSISWMEPGLQMLLKRYRFSMEDKNGGWSFWSRYELWVRRSLPTWLLCHRCPR